MALPMLIPAKPPWSSTPTAATPLPTAVPNSCNSLIESPTDTTDNIENNNKNNNNERPDDNGDDDDDDDDDVDCFPRQDKQPVLPQDVSPTATTANNPSLSLIESATDTDTNNKNNDPPNDDDDDDDDSTVIHDNRCDNIEAYDDNDDDDDTYGDYAYAYDEYNDFAYDDDDDSYASSSSEEDYYNCANVIIDMYGNTFAINGNDNIIPYDVDDDDNDNNKPTTIQAAQRQINAILAGRTTTSSIKAFTKQAKRKHDEFFFPKTAARTIPAYTNNDHDAYLHHRWNRSNRNTKIPV